MITPTLLNNRYKILSVLGGGGFGETFLAEDTQMPSSRRCVIKKLKPVADNLQVYQLVQERFGREAAILEDLGDRNQQIPKLYAYFTEKGEFYLVQEYIQGQTLTQKLHQQGLLNETEVKEILINILPVLDYVHSKRMVHRDIKPDNILIRSDDRKPVLIDFGAVKETMGTVVTASGNSGRSIVIGTPGFMPMEQSVGRPLFSSDLYSLGLTAIYLLTGKMPQQFATDHATGEMIWRHEAVNVSPSFAAVLDKAIQQAPRDRFATAREMLQALQTAPHAAPAYQPTVPAAPPPTPTMPSPLPPATPSYQPPVASQQGVRSQNGLVGWQQGVIIGGVVGACVIGGLWFFRGQPSTPDPTPTVVQSNPSSSSSGSTSSNNSGGQTPIQTIPNSNSQNTQPDDTIPETPTKNPSTNSAAAAITEQQATSLINQWLQAKRVMFAPPYNPQLAASLTTGKKYEETAGSNGSINDLKQNGQYYRYGTQTIEGVDDFSVNGNQARIQVTITEERTLYNRNGSINTALTGSDTGTYIYNLQLENGRWKIASSDSIN